MNEVHDDAEELPEHGAPAAERFARAVHQVLATAERRRHRPLFHQPFQTRARRRQHVGVRVQLDAARAADQLDVPGRVAALAGHVQRPAHQAALLPQPPRVELAEQLGVHLGEPLALKRGEFGIRLPLWVLPVALRARAVAGRGARRRALLHRAEVPVPVRVERILLVLLRAELGEHQVRTQVHRDALAGVLRRVGVVVVAHVRRRVRVARAVQQHQRAVHRAAAVPEPRVRVALPVEPSPLRGGEVERVRVPERAVPQQNASAVHDPVVPVRRRRVVDARRRHVPRARHLRPSQCVLGAEL